MDGPMKTRAPAIGSPLVAFFTYPSMTPLGPATQPGNLNDPTRVCHPDELVVW